jgi:hypothetical protein
MVKKAIIIQVSILCLFVLLLVKPYFFDVRLKEAQREIDFGKLVRKTALDAVYFNQLDVTKGKFIIIGWGSYTNQAFPLFDEIVKNQEKLSQYKVIAVSPFVEKKGDVEQLLPYSGIMTFKFNEMDLDRVFREIPFTTIPEYKEQKEKIKGENNEMTDDYAVVIVIDNNEIVWAKKKVTHFSEIYLNE